MTTDSSRRLIWLALAVGLAIAVAASMLTGAGSIVGGVIAGSVCVGTIWVLQNGRLDSRR